MTFWRQGSNDSLNDKLVRPRSSNSYWDGKQQSPANEDFGTKLKDAQDVFTEVPEKLADDIESALDDKKDEITKAVDEIFPETPKDSNIDLPDLPSIDAELDDQLEEVDSDLLAPPSLDAIGELDETSLESLSLDQEEEDDLDDDDLDDDLPEAPPIFSDEASELTKASDDIDIENGDVKDLETSSLENLDLEIPELEDVELTSGSSELGKMPSVIPSSGNATGNAAHKYDEEEFQANDTSSDSESETVTVPKAVSDLEEIDTIKSDDKSSNDDNGSGQVIAFPPNQGRSDDGLTDEERLAVTLSSGAALSDQANEKAPHFTARITKPKSDSAIVTPRRTEPSYYDNGEQVYEAGLDDDDGYYVPSHSDSDESGRRIALYLAGAASISAICGAVYLMLPKGSDEGTGLTTAGTTVTPTLPANIADDVKTDDSSTVAASETETAAIGNSSALSDLAAANTAELNAAVAEPISDLFASTTDTDKPEVSISEIETRSLSPNTTTLSSPNLKTPEVSAPKVTEEAPRLTLSESRDVAKSVTSVPTPKETTVAETPTPAFSTPKAAPKLAKRKLFSSNSSADTSTPKTVSAPKLRVPKILRSNNSAKTIAPTISNVGERIYDGVLRAGSMPQTIIDSLFAQGAYLASKEQKQFAYNVRHAAKTTPDGEVNSITTQNGTRVDLNFLTTQNEVRPTFVTRSDKMEPLPSYMLLKDDWVRTTDTTKLYAAATQYDQRVLKNLPIGTSLERMGSITDSSGEQWSLVGQKGVAIGFVPSLDLTSISNTGVTSVTPFTTAVSNSVIERIDVSVPCRDYTMSIGGAGSMHSACMTPEGDWMTKEAANSGLSYAIAPPSTTTVSTTAPITTSPITTAPIRSTERIFNSAPLTTTTSALSADAEAILFQPQTLRRDARHGQGSANQRISALFEGNTQAKAIPISSPEGQSGRLSIQADQSTQTAVPVVTNNVTLKTGLVQLDKQVRLMSAPAGSVVPEAETVMRGEVLEAISVSTTPTGESWTLLGSDGVGYGYVLTDYVSSTSASSVTYDGFNSATGFGGAAPEASAETAEVYVPAAPECQTATFSTGSETGVLKACLQPNGMWTAEIVPSNSYVAQTTVSVDAPMGSTKLF